VIIVMARKRMLRVSRISGIWNAEYESAKVRQDEMRFRERKARR